MEKLRDKRGFFFANPLFPFRFFGRVSMAIGRIAKAVKWLSICLCKKRGNMRKKERNMSKLIACLSVLSVISMTIWLLGLDWASIQYPVYAFFRVLFFICLALLLVCMLVCLADVIIKKTVAIKEFKQGKKKD